MGKQAVAFLLDASPSMETPYPNKKTGTQPKDNDTNTDSTAVTMPQQSTRFSLAKQVIENMIVSLMLQSVTNECTVIVLKTPKTQHHKLPNVEEDEDEEEYVDEDDIPFPHLTELTNGVARPTVELLQQLSQVQTTSQEDYNRIEEEEHGAGDFISGLLLAADALYERTHKRRYSARKIILFTDATHTVHMPVTQVLTVVDALRNMQCTITVIGLDFEHCVSTVYAEPAAAPTPDPAHSSSAAVVDSHKRMRIQKEENPSPDAAELEGDDQSEAENDGEEDFGEDNEEEEDEEDDDDEVVIYTQKSDRERLLLSLTEKTAGSVIAASDLHDIVEAEKGKRIPIATPRKFTLNIAPGLSLQARNSLLMSKATSVTLKTKAVLMDDDHDNNDHDHLPRPSLAFANNNTMHEDDDDGIGPTASAMAMLKVKHNALGEEMTDTVKNIVKYMDDDEPDDVVEDEYVTKAVRYGADLIPISAFDLEGLAAQGGAEKDDLVNLDFPRTNPRMDVLGYMDRDKISPLVIMGPPYCISGRDSVRTCAAIAALAQALHQCNKVAICTFFKTKTGNEPALGALFPVPLHSLHMLDDSSKVGGSTLSREEVENLRQVKNEGGGAEKVVSLPQQKRQEPPYMHLIFLQLPFAGDVKKITLDPLEDFLAPENVGTDAAAATCQESLETVTDNLIDALLLPPGVMTNGTVPSPFLRSWHQTKVKRAIHPEQKNALVMVRNTTIAATSHGRSTRGNEPPSSSSVIFQAGFGHDPMVTPANVLQGAQSALQDFYSTFNLQPVRTVSTASAAAAAKKQQQQSGGKASSKRGGRRAALHFRDYLG